ncbi:MAG TPA: hypothetical protein DHW65_00520 [Dehalococcoidia bacterium]|nr:hypothetical protein [Dehalococcoidia bacterium]
MRTKLAFLALLAASLLIATAVGPAAAQETTQLRGQIVNGTEGAEPPGELGVLMLITGGDGQLAGTGQTQADAEGRFVFDDVAVLEGAEYTVNVEHGSVFYSVSITAGELSEELTLSVYETTKDASIIHVERHVMVIAGVDKDGQRASAIEFVRLNNPSDSTLLPDLTNVEQISFLRFSLPPDASDLNVQSNLPGGDIASIGTGFALTSPVVPGPHTIDFSYVFPYEDETLAYRQSLVQGADFFQVLVPERIPDMSVTSLEAAEPVNIQGTSYRAYQGEDFPPGQGLQLEITGLPLPGVWARFSNSVTEGLFWQIAIPSALAATLIGMLLWGLFRGYKTESAVPGQQTTSRGVNAAERAAVVQSVAALDQQFEAGNIPGEEYSRQRRELMARVLHPTAETEGGQK